KPPTLRRGLVNPPLSFAPERPRKARRVWCRKNECPHSGHCARQHRRFDLLLRAFFPGGDGTFFAKAASTAPARTKPCRAYELHTAFPRESAARFERAAPGRWIGQRASGSVVSFLSLGRPFGRTHPAMAGGH